MLYDDNGISIDGPTSLSDSVDQVERFKSAGWAATRIDGHDPAAITAAIEAAKQSETPSLIACRTTIGFGAPNKGGTEKSHGSPLGADEIALARQKLGWTSPQFEIPSAILAQWRSAGVRGKPARAAWETRLASLDADKRAEFERRLKGDTGKLAAAVTSVKQKLAEAPKEIATRSASEFALETLTAALPEMIGGSADLTGSNNTRTKSMKAMSAADYSGRFIHYGVREHGMAAAMNGMALHGGIIPYSGTFLVFSDYCRPAIRLAALMGQRVIHVMTHDSIGLGEDGPTHQPVEHLAALRAIPNLKVFRPCDTVETVECWQIALESKDGPSVLALTRQNLPQLRLGFDERNRCALGAYELQRRRGRPRRGVAVRHRLGGGDRDGSQEAPRRAQGFRARRLSAVLRAPRRRAAGQACRRHRRGRRQCRDRGRHPPGLGRDHRLRRRICRNDGFRRQRAPQGSLPALRNYRRESG